MYRRLFKLHSTSPPNDACSCSRKGLMDKEGFPLRHRGVHVPDHLRKLELISSGASPRSRSGSFRPVAPPQSRRDLIPTKRRAKNTAADDHLASFFGNLTVWIDKKLHSASAHAGYDKIHLYLALLRCFIDEITPHEKIQRLVEGIEAYVSYLSAPEHTALTTSPTKTHQHQSPQTAISPRLVATKGMLSPRIIQAMANEVAPEAALSSPRITKKRPKKIIELSDHEESILQVALFYDEVVDQLSGGMKKGKKHREVSLTQQWLQFASEKHKRVLKKIKAKVSKQTLFGSGTAPPSTPGAHSSRIGSGGAGQSTGVSRAHSLEFSAYFSLLTLCLQETTRRISVFSADIATFLWSILCQDTIHSIERMFDDVLALQSSSYEALQKLRESRQEVQNEISHCEREIQRLQGQNMRSLVVWELERQEMTLLEREEVWHGHCKALLLKSLLNLGDEVNQATWLQVRAPVSPDQHNEASNDQTSVSVQVPRIDYHRLPVGAALLHFRVRSRVVYMAHLVLLCRCFLHLQEKRSLREVMESTSTNPEWSSPPPSPSQQNQQQSAFDAYDWPPVVSAQSTSSASMERISLGELLTLKDINHALRAIEELYISVGASGDHSHSPTLPSACLGCDVGTQFPSIGDEPTTGSNTAFLKSLAYSTMAAAGPNPPPVIRAGSNRGRRRRNAEIALVHPPMGSGRRLGRSAASQDEPAAPSQPVIRLAKAWLKLPKHCRDVLILPLLEGDPFPPDKPASVVESLSKDEILSRIQWLYASVMEASFAKTASSWNSAEARNGSVIPLSRHLWKSWNTEHFVDFIHAAFVEKYDNDVTSGEREFVRFLASIQLLYSGLGAALNPTTTSGGPSQANDKIYFFARMTTLFNLEARDKLTKNRLPAQLFPIFFYAMHVLQQVAVTKKHIDDGGLVVDVWTMAGTPVAAHPSTPLSGTGGSHRGRRVRVTTRSYTFSNHAHHTNKFVLLESVKTLLLYLLEGTSPDASALVDERIQFLSERAILAKVSLISSIIPGAYEISSSPRSHTTSPGMTVPVANGELTDVFILPLDFAVQVLVNAWLQQHKALLQRLTIAMRAADIDASGEITFEEFTHVMMVGSASQAPNTISSGQLTQVYASLLSETPHKRGVRWQELIVAVADEIDLLGMDERLTNLDFRSIQHALIRAVRGNATTAWLANPSYRAGDAVSLYKAWTLNHHAMRDNFALTFQAENALEGVCLWQSGNARVDRVEKLLRDGKHRAKTPRVRVRRSSIVGTIGGPTTSSPASRYDATDIEIPPEDLDVAWRALYYLQLDHAQAHHIADHVRVKLQQRNHKNALVVNRKTSELRGSQQSTPS